MPRFRPVRSACRDAGLDPRVVLRLDDYVACQCLVAARMGVAIMPGLALEHPTARGQRDPAARPHADPAHLGSPPDRLVPDPGDGRA